MLFVFLVVVVLLPMPSYAEITKIVIDKREPFAAGHEERYQDQTDYVRRISQAARTLLDDRFLLPEDAERLIAEAKKTNPFVEAKPQ